MHVRVRLTCCSAVFGRVAMAEHVFDNDGTASFTVTAMTFGGLMSRMFTTLVEVKDRAVRLTISLN